MQELKASKLFSNKDCIENIDFDNSEQINIDFSDVSSVNLKDICTLLDMKKVAVLNNKSLYFSNANPKISQMLELTRLNKTVSNKKTVMKV